MVTYSGGVCILDPTGRHRVIRRRDSQQGSLIGVKRLAVYIDNLYVRESSPQVVVSLNRYLLKSVLNIVTFQQGSW